MQRFFGTWKTSNSHQVHSLPFFVFVFCPSILGLYPIEVTWPAWKMIFLLTMVDFQQDYEPTSHGDPEKIRKGFSKWWYVATLFTQCGQISCDGWCSNSPSCQTACHFFLHSFFFMMYCHKTHTHIYMYMYNNYNADAELPERAMERYMYNYVYLLLLRHTRPRSLILVFCRLPTPHRFWCFKPLNVQRKDSGERSWHSTSESWGAMCLSETFL